MTFKSLFSSHKLVNVQKEVGDLLDKMIVKDLETSYKGIVLSPDKKVLTVQFEDPDDAENLVTNIMYSDAKLYKEFNSTYKSHIESMHKKGMTVVFTWNS